MISWAAVASSLPKPKTSEAHSLKRTNPFLNKTPAAGTVNALFSTTKKAVTARISLIGVRKRTQCEKHNLHKLSEEKKQQLLSRYRTRLLQSTAPTRHGKERLVPRRKRLSRLKSGIIRDRMIRRTLQQFAQSNDATTQHQSVHKKESCNSVVSVIPPSSFLFQLYHACLQINPMLLWIQILGWYFLILTTFLIFKTILDPSAFNTFTMLFHTCLKYLPELYYTFSGSPRL